MGRWKAFYNRGETKFKYFAGIIAGNVGVGMLSSDVGLAATLRTIFPRDVVAEGNFVQICNLFRFHDLQHRWASAEEMMREFMIYL